jgi:hypothetical protein
MVRHDKLGDDTISVDVNMEQPPSLPKALHLRASRNTWASPGAARLEGRRQQLHQASNLRRQMMIALVIATEHINRKQSMVMIFIPSEA